MLVNILDIISIISLALLLLLGTVLLGKLGKNRLSNILLSCFMFSNALLIGYFLLNSFDIINFYDTPVFYLLLGPFLYLYIKSLCDKDFILKRIHIIHLSPFLLCSLYLLLRAQFNTSLSNEIIPISDFTLSVIENLIFNVILSIQIILYMVYSFISIHNYRILIMSYFSSVEKIDLNWLYFIINAFIIMWLLDICNSILVFTGTEIPGLHSLLFNIAMTINFMFASYVVYRGLQHSDHLSGIKESSKYSSSRLTESDSNRYYNELSAYMEEQKPYTIASISITGLAEKTNIPQRYLSQIINEKFNQNFFDFINKYRIEEAKRLILDLKDPKKTILEILYEVGFNSKSVFNNSFKKYTGTTPSNFKKNITQ